MNIEKENRKISKPVSINSMTDTELDAELEKGYQDIISGNVISAMCVYSKKLGKNINYKMRLL